MDGKAEVRWNGWEPGVLARAASEGKLIFLLLDVTWSAGCRLLHETSLSDPRVAAMLNDDFVAVHADADRRPDLNERYNQGGWPTTAVLLPDGKLLTGSTYLAPDALTGVLKKCRDFYARDRTRVDACLRQGTAAGDASGARPAAPQIPGVEDLTRVRRAVMSVYDPVHPGFFREPKFPVPEILAFLRDLWCVEGDAEAGDRLLSALRTMRSSALFDPVEGGFFRYAARRDWTDPQVEKVLPDNAALLGLYAAAYGKTREAPFAETVRDLLRFLFANLHDPGTGAFFGSQAADAEYFRRPGAERSLRAPPPVDRTVFSEHNGRMASALVAAHRACGAPAGGDLAADSLLARAQRLAAYLHQALWREAEGQARYLPAPGAADAAPRGLLHDHAAVAAAHLDLFDATGQEEPLRRAEAALSFLVVHLYRKESAGFLDRRPAPDDFGGLAAPCFPFGANALAASALLRCARAAGRRDLAATGERVLCGLSAAFEAHGAFAAPYGSALVVYRGPEER